MVDAQAIATLHFHRYQGVEFPAKALLADGNIAGTPDFVVGYATSAGGERQPVSPFNCHTLVGLMDVYLIVDPETGEKRTLLPRVRLIEAVQR